MQKQKIMKRADQKVEDTWNLQDLYENETLFSQDGEKVAEMMEQFPELKGTIAQRAESFLKIMEQFEEMNYIFERMYVYANEKSHEDTADAKYQQMSGEMQLMAASMGQCTAWLEPEILALPEETLKQYFASCEPLRRYERFIEQITMRREHVLNAEQEEMLSKVAELAVAPSNIFSMFNNADIKFPNVADKNRKRHPLTVGTYITYLQGEDEVLRKHAFNTLYKVYGQYQNTLAATFYANLKQADFFAKARNHKNALEEALDDNEIPTKVYTNLIETVNKHLPAMYEYVKLRKKLLGKKELHMYDVYAPIVNCPIKEYSFEEAKQIVLEGLKPLGEDYARLLQQGFDHRWIDVYENQGKRTGAYSWGAYGTHPYVLLNFHGTLNDVFTLAHEMGHALHTWHSNENQNFLDAGYSIFVAEVASTCNEALLIHDLMNRSTDVEEQKYLINYFLDQIKGTIYRQTMFAEFEMITHRVVEEGGVLTAQQLNDIYLNLNKRYFGEDMISDPQIALEWARIPHFYTPFYVYQYATGFAAAIAISSKILAGEEGIVEKYKEFLSGGCSKNPIDLLKICGVDMSSPEPVEKALEVFAEYVQRMNDL